MPLYEYKCQICRKITESIHKETVKLIMCSKCGGEAFRQMSASNIKVKGYCEANGYAKSQ